MSRRAKSARIAIPALALFGLLAATEAFVRLRDISPLVLPAPSAVAIRIVENVDVFLPDAWVTFSEAALGFVLAMTISVLLAGWMVLSPTVRWMVDPLSAAIRVTPVVALAPALVLWLGFGALPKVIVAALITFPPFLINAHTGFRSVDDGALEVLQTLNASVWDVFRTLRIPSALPYLFSAAKLSVSLALIGAVVAEWAGSAQGLGYRIVRAQADLETTTVWAAVAVLAVFSIALTSLVALAERWFLRWR